LRAAELVSGTVTLLTVIHGSNSPQVRSFNEAIAAHQKSKEAAFRIARLDLDSAIGTLTNLKRELDAGIVGNVRQAVTGEILADLLQLAKVALDEGTEASKNVAAVLAAAAYEDTIRRMGSSFCAIQTRDDLSTIVIALKDGGVLQGAQFGTVQAQLQFRNDALHTHWAKIDAIGVSTVIQLVQALILKHFA
jgi:hypothetical protein